MIELLAGIGFIGILAFVINSWMDECSSSIWLNVGVFRIRWWHATELQTVYWFCEESM